MSAKENPRGNDHNRSCNLKIANKLKLRRARREGKEKKRGKGGEEKYLIRQVGIVQHRKKSQSEESRVFVKELEHERLY